MEKTEILNELKAYLGYTKDADFAVHLGIKPNVLANWRSRETFNEDVISEKCDFINKSWLLTGEGEMLKEGHTTPDGEKITKIAKYHELSIRALSRKLGLSTPQGLYDIIKGKNNLSRQMADRILIRYPEVDPDWLVTGRNEMIKLNGFSSSKVSVMSDLEYQLFQDRKTIETLRETVDMLLRENNKLNTELNQLKETEYSIIKR